jgi:bacterioferritin-associated ferredoxin
MIVCHCNVLTDKQFLQTLEGEALHMPHSPVQAMRCLGCAPNCGRCVPTVRELFKQARANCAVGCPSCPASATAVANDDHDLGHVATARVMIAAE